jgi:hypothetical protein
MLGKYYYLLDRGVDGPLNISSPNNVKKNPLFQKRMESHITNVFY